MKVILVDREAFRARRRALVDEFGKPDYDEGARRKIAEGDGPYVHIGERSMMWECPGCGHVYAGNIGPEPVSGWDSPQWKVTGTPDAPTLAPSLGCGRWRTGECASGHWWLRDGELVPA